MRESSGSSPARAMSTWATRSATAATSRSGARPRRSHRVTRIAVVRTVTDSPTATATSAWRATSDMAPVGAPTTSTWSAATQGPGALSSWAWTR